MELKKKKWIKVVNTCTVYIHAPLEYNRAFGPFSVCQNCLRLKSELAFLYFFFFSYSNVSLGFSTDTCRPSVCCRRLSLMLISVETHDV